MSSAACHAQGREERQVRVRVLCPESRRRFSTSANSPGWALSPAAPHLLQLSKIPSRTLPLAAQPLAVDNRPMPDPWGRAFVTDASRRKTDLQGRDGFIHRSIETERAGVEGLFATG